MDNSGMLQGLRQGRNLHTVVFTVLALAWLVALAAGVQARAALPVLLPVDVCTSAPSGHGLGHAGEHPGTSSHHSAPDCLLCIALAAPPGFTLAPQRPPLSAVGPSRAEVALTVPVWRAQAPMPARGPPALFHA